MAGTVKNTDFNAVALGRPRILLITAIVLMPMLGGCKGGDHASAVTKNGTVSAATRAAATPCVSPATRNATIHATRIGTAAAGRSPPAASLTKTRAANATTAKRLIPIGRIKPGEGGCPPKIQPPSPPETHK